jgi:hypothetical protein
MDIEIYSGNNLIGNLQATPKVFNTGSFGLFANGKISDDIGNTYQVIINMPIIGSKKNGNDS